MTDSPLSQIETEFRAFLDNNSYSSISTSKGSDGEETASILNPWGDGSLEIHIPEQHSALSAILNNIILPERLSALYHIITNKIEVIYTAHALKPQHAELLDRRFTFAFRGISHECEFSRSSDELLSIARNTYPRSASDSNFRNIQSFNMYMLSKERGFKAPLPHISEPVSFWITNVAWDEIGTIELIENLNFYLTYYDDESPFVLIHSLQDNQASSIAARTRYIKGSFPSVIQARELDSHILSFWIAARESNLMMRFMLYYRVIEYAAMGWIDDKIRNDLRRTLSAPDAAANIGTTIERIVSSMNVQKLEDTARFRSVIRNIVDPDLIWSEIEKTNRRFVVIPNLMVVLP